MNIFSGIRFRIILHIFLGLLLGGFVALSYLSSSDTFRQYLQSRIEQQFVQDYGCSFKADLERLDLFSCSMTLSNIVITATSDNCMHQSHDQQSWSITAEKLHIKGSWLSLLLSGYLKVCLNFEHVIMFESFEKAPEKLVALYQKMLNQPMVAPIIYDVISITDGLLYLKRTTDSCSLQIPYVCHLRMQQQSTRMQLYLHDGVVHWIDSPLIKNIAGLVRVDLPASDPVAFMSGQAQLNYQLVKSDQDIPGFFAGKIEHGIGEFALKTEDGSIIIDPIKINSTPTTCWCDVMIAATSQVLQYFNVPDIASGIDGKVGLHVQCDLYQILQTIQASIVLDEIMYQSKQLFPGGKIVVQQHDKHGFSGIFMLQDQKMFEVEVDLVTKKLSLQNLVDLQIPFDHSYKILKHGFQCLITYDQSGIVAGTYTIDIDHQILQDRYTISGKFEIKNGQLSIDGMFEDIVFQGLAQLYPDYIFHTFTAKRNENLLLDFTTDPDDPLYVAGSVDFSLMQRLVPEVLQPSFAQNGSFIFKGSLKNGICSAMVQAHYAHIRVPYIYNVIQNMSATCELNFHEKNLVFKDIFIEWYEGKISCLQAKIYFDKDFTVNFVHAPCMFHDVMLSWNKGVYGLVSGSILLSKLNKQERLRIQGQLIVQKSELKENIFSTDFQEIVSGISYANFSDDQTEQPQIDISLFTKEPLHINTSFLGAKALVDVRIQGLLKKTKLSGSLKLLTGALHFPYKPLEIVEGRLLFVPEQPFDPILEFVAKGKIKRFHVTMKAWGSALDPHVSFESQPYLSEEQIISLLLLGVEDQSLSLMVPAFLTQRLKDIIFGPAISNIKLKSAFDRLLQSLKYVRFIPQFTNQAGRGGVRGIFEIDATEHLQGKIDTNFAHLEDTKFDVDYAVCDDITLRLQKDGPSTYGGQVEFCWKFS